MKPRDQAKRAQEVLKLLKPKKRNEILSRLLGENVEIENSKSLTVTYKNGKYKIEDKKDKRISLEISKAIMPKLMKIIENQELSALQTESLSQKNPEIYRRKQYAVTLNEELTNNKNLLNSIMSYCNQGNNSSIENLKVTYDANNDNYKISGVSSGNQKIKIEIPRSALQKLVADDLAKQLMIAAKDLLPESLPKLINTSVQGTINNVVYNQEQDHFEVGITTFPEGNNKKFSIKDMADVPKFIVNVQKVVQSQNQVNAKAPSTDYPIQAAYSTTMNGQQPAASSKLGDYPNPAPYSTTMNGQQPAASSKLGDYPNPAPYSSSMASPSAGPSPSPASPSKLGDYPNPAPYSTSMVSPEGPSPGSKILAHDLPDVPNQAPLTRQQYDALSPGKKLVIETVNWDRELKSQNASLQKLNPQALYTLLTSKGYIDAQGYGELDSKTVSIQYNQTDNKLILTGNFKSNDKNTFTSISTDVEVERYYEFKADLRKALAEQDLPIPPNVDSQVPNAPPPKPPMKNNHEIAQELQEAFNELDQRQLSQVLGLQKNDLLTRNPNLIQVKFKNPNFEISLKGSPEESITRSKKDLPKIRKALAQVNANKLDGLDNTDLSTDNASSTPPPAPSLTVASRVAAQLQKQQEQRSVIFSQKPEVLAQEFLRQLKGGLLSSIVSDYNKRENSNYNLRTSDLNVVYDSDKNKFKITGKSFYRGQDRTMWLSADEVRDAKVNPNKPSNEVQAANANPSPIVGTYASTAPIQAMEAAQQPYAQAPNNGQLQSGEGKNAYNSPAPLNYNVPGQQQPAIHNVPTPGAGEYKEIVLPNHATQQYAGVGVNTKQRQTAQNIEPSDAPSIPYAELDRSEFDKYKDDAPSTPNSNGQVAQRRAAGHLTAFNTIKGAESDAGKSSSLSTGAAQTSQPRQKPKY